MTEIIWIFLSYILGSIPFGYIFSRLAGKDPRKIGWKKTSGSNVFKNVGKIQGVLTGLFDVLKGYLAVYGAQVFGMGMEIQVLCGAAAVIGHNWSIFLKFSGGRGIGTFIGALLGLSVQMAGVVILIIVLGAIVWDAAIGTLLFLAILTYFFVYPPAFLDSSGVYLAGLLVIYTLVPIFFKRLNPLTIRFLLFE